MNPSHPTIFIQIAAYRDPDLPATLHNLLSRAAEAQRIHLGICLQLASADPEDWGNNHMPEHPHLQLHNCLASESRGACWARRQAQQFFQGETFLLQIDSHMRAVPNWDLKLLESWERCNDAKAVLSVYPNGFKQPCRLNMSTLPVMAARRFDKYGILQFQGISRYRMPEQKPSEPLTNAFIAGGFLFGPGSIVSDVPYDPYLYFDGEEISVSARLWTHGYNIYSPNELILFHLYKSKSNNNHAAETHWNDHQNWFELNRRSLVRVHTLLNSLKIAPVELKPSTDDVKDLKNYGLGQSRSLIDYQLWAGIDFSNQRINPKALSGQFPAGQAC